MSLRPEAIGPIPEETARVARAAFPDGATAMRVRDELGTIYEDEDFADLFPARGRPAEAPWRLALVTILQFAEGLAGPPGGRRGARADRLEVRARAGVDRSGLRRLRPVRVPRSAGRPARPSGCCSTRCWLRCRERGLLKARGRQRTDSTHVLAAIRALNRLGVVGRDDAPRPRQPGGRRPGLAAAPRPARVGRALRAPGRGRSASRAGQAAREALALADRRGRPRAARRRSMAARRRLGCGRSRRSQTLRRVWVQQFYRRREGGTSALADRPARASHRRPASSARPTIPRRTTPGSAPPVGRLQGPPDRDLRGRRAPPDHPRRDHAGPGRRRGADAGHPRARWQDSSCCRPSTSSTPATWTPSCSRRAARDVRGGPHRARRGRTTSWQARAGQGFAAERLRDRLGAAAGDLPRRARPAAAGHRPWTTARTT